MAGPHLKLLLWAVVLPACGSTVGSEPALPLPVATTLWSTPTPLSDRAWEFVHSVRLGLELPLPSRLDWAVNDQQGSWLVAQHAASRSELRLRAWRAPRLSTPEACLEQVRLWRPDFPKPSLGTSIEERQLVAPPAYRGVVWVGLTAVGDGVEGHAVAVGARTGRCFAFWYRTRIRGEAAEEVVAQNLAVVSAGVVDRIRELGLEDAVEREPASPQSR